MPDYSKGKIYKLTTPLSDEVYYGSTIQLLSKRKGGHKDKYLKWKKTNVKYISSCKLFEYDCNEVCITLIENYPCNSKEELEARERYYIENNICINKNIPQRTQKEYREDNQDIIKEYREKNNEKLKEYHKQHYLENKEKIKDRNKNYCLENKEKVNQYKKEWELQNKERLKEKRKKWVEENKERLKQYKKEWELHNKEKIKRTN